MKAVIIGVFMFLLVSNAGAACTQADLTATWKVYVTNYENGKMNWTRCTFALNNTGALVTASSSCFETSGTKSTIKSGKLVVDSSCKITGSIDAGGSNNTINEAQMSRDKETFSGVGTYSGGLFLLNGVKK